MIVTTINASEIVVTNQLNATLGAPHRNNSNDYQVPKKVVHLNAQ